MRPDAGFALASNEGAGQRGRSYTQRHSARPARSTTQSNNSSQWRRAMSLFKGAVVASVVILGGWSCSQDPQEKSAGSAAANTAAEDVPATISQLEREWV